MSPKVINESLPTTAPSSNSGFSKGSLGLYVMIIIITSVIKKASITIVTQAVLMVQWDIRALMTKE